MAEVDTSFYKDATAENPLDMAGKVIEYKNKLLGNVHNQQTIEKTAIGIDSDKVNLAMKRFGIMNDSISSLIGDKGFGTENLKPKINGVMGRLVKDGVLSAQHAVEALQGIPDDPKEQANALRNFHSMTQSAIERGNSFFGQPQVVNTGNSLVPVQVPQYPGKPVLDRGNIPLQLPPSTETVQADPTKPGYGGKTLLGPTPAPAVRQGPGVMPATPEAPARAMVPSTPKVIGDREGVASGLYPTPTPSQRVAGGHATGKPIITALPPGTTAPLEASGAAYAKDLAESRNYGDRVTPLRMAIPLLEKLGKTGSGPGQETLQHIKSFAQTMGLPVPNEKTITDYAEAKKYLAQNASLAAPPGTNIPSVMAAFEANPNMSQPNKAAVELSKTLMSLSRMRQASVLAFSEAKKAEGLSNNDYAEWAANWSTRQDPRAFGADLMTPENRENLKKSIKPGSEQAKRFRASVDTAQKLGLFGDVERPEVK